MMYCPSLPVHFGKLLSATKVELYDDGGRATYRIDNGLARVSDTFSSARDSITALGWMLNSLGSGNKLWNYFPHNRMR
jgi:hypothetical protein